MVLIGCTLGNSKLGGKITREFNLAVFLKKNLHEVIFQVYFLGRFGKASYEQRVFYLQNKTISQSNKRTREEIHKQQYGYFLLHFLYFKYIRCKKCINTCSVKHFPYTGMDLCFLYAGTGAANTKQWQQEFLMADLCLSPHIAAIASLAALG